MRACSCQEDNVYSCVALDNYDAGEYPPFAVTVDIALFTMRHGNLQVLLIERGEDPFLGALALPGGFVQPDENLDQAATRELAEETGLSEGAWHLEQLASYGAPDRDPRMRVVTVAYWAICADLPTIKGGGDAADAILKPVDEIERGSVRFAFDHDRIIKDALERARSKLEYTTLAAKFCPPEFTIGQLRRVYEAVWNTRLDPGNFQRNVQESGAFERRTGTTSSPLSRRGRPAATWALKAPTFTNDHPIAHFHRAPARRWRPDQFGAKPNERRHFVASKYDHFWGVLLDVIEEKLNEVADGSASQLSIDISELTTLPNRPRAGWSGSVCVQNGQAESRGNAAHMNSLANLLNQKPLRVKSSRKVRLSIKGHTLTFRMENR